MYEELKCKDVEEIFLVKSDDLSGISDCGIHAFSNGLVSVMGPTHGMKCVKVVASQGKGKGNGGHSSIIK